MAAAAYTALVVSIIVIARLLVAYRASLRELRQTDPLTGLPNRLGFEAILKKHLKLGTPLSIVWLDLDGFRKVNELHGHAGGDILLTQIGPRIRRCLRPGDATARVSGDQFLILLRTHEAAAAITSRILGSVNATAGISRFPNDADNSSQLLLLAEAAMRQAKATARGRAVVFEPSMSANSTRQEEIASLIRSALTHERFHLMFQPIVDVEGKIVRMEALVRIDDPILGRVTPLEFIGVAEESGLIIEVGAWILRRACQHARDWRDAGLQTAVTVNLSPHQLETSDLADGIVNEIAQWRLGKAAVTVHITGVPKSLVAVERMRSAGIAVSCQQPLFDEIRVGEPFELPANCPEITVIARGIETPQQLDLAHAAGCDFFQGFQIAPPLEPPDATEILRAGVFAFVGSGFNRSEDPLS